MAYSEYIKRRIEQAAQEAGNLTSLAKACGVQQSTLSRYMSGEQQGLGFSVLCKIMDHIGIGENQTISRAAPTKSVDEDASREENQRLRQELSETRKRFNDLNDNYQALVNDYRNFMLNSVPRNQDTSALESANVTESHFEFDSPDSEIVQEDQRKYGK